MMGKHHIIYIPGLGDTNSSLQGRVLKLWSLFGLAVHYLPLDWATKETYAAKEARVLKQIDHLVSEGKQVSLVGVSAGASAVLNCFAQRPNDIHRVIYICGKVSNIDLVTPNRRLQQNPDFVESLEQLPKSLKKLSGQQRRHITSVRPLYDGIVPVPDTKLPEVPEVIVPSVGHVFTIATLLLLGAPLIRHLLKPTRKNKSKASELGPGFRKNR